MTNIKDDQINMGWNEYLITKIMLIVCVTLTYPVIRAIKKVKAGTTSVIAEARIGLLYPIPKYINSCTEQL